MSENLQTRLERAEAHIAHLERQLEQLNEVLVEHGQMLNQMKKQVQINADVMKTFELERIKANNPKPPHYQ